MVISTKSILEMLVEFVSRYKKKVEWNKKRREILMEGDYKNHCLKYISQQIQKKTFS